MGSVTVVTQESQLAQIEKMLTCHHSWPPWVRLGETCDAMLKYGTSHTVCYRCENCRCGYMVYEEVKHYELMRNGRKYGFDFKDPKGSIKLHPRRTDGTNYKVGNRTVLIGEDVERILLTQKASGLGGRVRRIVSRRFRKRFNQLVRGSNSSSGSSLGNS